MLFALIFDVCVSDVRECKLFVPKVEFHNEQSCQVAAKEYIAFTDFSHHFPKAKEGTDIKIQPLCLPIDDARDYIAKRTPIAT